MDSSSAKRDSIAAASIPRTVAAICGAVRENGESAFPVRGAAREGSDPVRSAICATCQHSYLWR